MLALLFAAVFAAAAGGGPAGAATSTVPAPVSPTVVTFAWGGGNASQMDTLNLFRQYGMHATYYIPSGPGVLPSKTTNCATSQYLTLPDIRKIAAG